MPQQREQRDNSGVLFKNDRRGDNERAPNAKGRACIGGVMYWVSAWTKEGQNGKYQSLSFEPMDDQQAPPPVNSRSVRTPAEDFRQRQASKPPPQQPFGDEDQFKEADIPF